MQSLRLFLQNEKPMPLRIFILIFHSADYFVLARS
jgi:hypothetical protein